MSIKELVQKTLQDTTNQRIKIDLANPTVEQLTAIKETTGIELTDFQRTMDNYAIKHTFRKHGNDKLETLRGQIGVTEKDFEKIDSIIDNPDEITHGGINNIGREVILYRKNLENQYVYVEEIRPAKKEAAMQTLYIRKNKKAT
jgi:hypothetical protein